MKSIVLVKKLLGLVEMKSGLVSASFSLPVWQAVKMIFFAPCRNHSDLFYFLMLPTYYVYFSRAESFSSAFQ